MHGGQEGAYLYFLYQGEVRLMRTTLDGREKILMCMTAGGVTGETPFFDEVPAHSSIVAATDCVVYAFSQDCVRHEIIPHYPELTLALLQSLASKVRVLCNQSVSLSLEELPSRICRFLRLRVRDGDNAPCVSPGLNRTGTGEPARRSPCDPEQGVARTGEGIHHRAVCQGRGIHP